MNEGNFLTSYEVATAWWPAGTGHAYTLWTTVPNPAHSLPDRPWFINTWCEFSKVARTQS